jgi:outer membrane protein TolC
VYGIENERQIDQRWDLPRRPVEADPRSRIDYRFDADREPIPPDDPSARLFQVSAGRPFEFAHWAKRGTAPIESNTWTEYLPRQKDGSVLLSRESVIQLGLLNSRDYQTQIENLYTTSLAVALARFNFMTQPFSNWTNQFSVMGGADEQIRSLQLSSVNGFSQNLLSGGQLLATLSNAMVWQFSPKGLITAPSNLAVVFTQPFLRGATLRITTQPLSLAERQMLYAVRTFAQFRRSFYVTVVAGGGYLGLLGQLQAIRNARENLAALKRGLDEQDASVNAGFVSIASRDTLGVQYQTQQLLLVQQEAGLQTALDGYKAQLGLPPELSMTVDDSPLRTFELSDPRIEALRRRIDALNLALLEPKEMPPAATLFGALDQLAGAGDELRGLLKSVRVDLRKLRERLSMPLLDDDLPPALPVTGRSTEPGPRALAERIVSRLTEIDQRIAAIDEVAREIRVLLGAPGDREAAKSAVSIFLGVDPVVYPWPGDEAAAFEALKDLVGRRFLSRINDVFVAQNQIRVYLIELTPVDITSDQAIVIALENRQDLMNARAQVTDAWRNVEVAANALLGILNLTYSGTLANRTGGSSLFGFDANFQSQQVGFAFNAPVNRYLERNLYRTAQIDYQQARRFYMQTRDDIVLQIRLDVRNLLLNRRQFEISREQVILAARAVEQAEFDLRNSRDPNVAAGLTQQFLNTLSQLLTAKNTLVGNWVSYETARMSLYRDFGIMDIDSQGIWTNESLDPASLAARPERPAGERGGDTTEFDIAPDIFREEAPPDARPPG